jgi:HAD superfamily hydrolase (TIGR01509 family)
MGIGGMVAAVRDFDLVIFDCDGVLVDSEMLSANVLMGMMAEEDLPITVEMFRTDFLGRSFANASEQAAKRFGRPLPDDFQERYRSRLLAEMSQSLQAMDGVQHVLRGLQVPFCLATSSSPQRLALSLSVSGLAVHFEGLCTTASEVAHGKPAPDVFLLASKRMQVPASRCLVVEDSEMGVRAARAAGMAVWHFAGGAHIRSGYALPADVPVDRVVANMAELAEAFGATGLSSNSRVAV